MTIKYPLLSYSNKISAVQPYIVVPILDRQDQIILGPEKILEKHNAFINSLGRGTELMQTIHPFARSFRQGDYLNNYITFPSSRTEESGRGGLSLTLGVLIHESILQSQLLCYDFLNYYLELFDRFFETDLNNHGESVFIELLENKGNYEMLNRKLVELFKELLNCISQFHTLKKILFINRQLSKVKRGITKGRFPRRIFTIADLEERHSYKTLMPFFYAVDRYVNKYKSCDIDYSTLLTSKANYVEVYPCTKELLYELASNTKIIEVNYERRCVFL